MSSYSPRLPIDILMIVRPGFYSVIVGYTIYLTWPKNGRRLREAARSPTALKTVFLMMYLFSLIVSLDACSVDCITSRAHA